MSTPADDMPIRPAATVVLLRGMDSELEVLLVRRNSKLAVYGGAWVFPGGRIDTEDGWAADAVAERQQQAARRAAVRELQEEAGLGLGEGELVHFAQWVTPPGRTRRFDTWYFAAPAPAGEVRIDEREVDAHRWMRPADALRARQSGEIELPPPTFVTLASLAQHGSASSALSELSAGGVTHFEPRPVPVEGGAVFLYSEDAGYAERDPHCDAPHHRIVVSGADWRYVRKY